MRLLSFGLLALQIAGQQAWPKFNVTWKPTYVMSESTITNPDGGSSGPDRGATLDMDARYGIIAYDGGTEYCMNWRLGPPEDICMYAKSWENMEAQARLIKGISPNTHVWHYRNMQLGLARNEHDCPKMYDPAYSGYWLHTKDGNYFNETRAFPFTEQCKGYFPNASYPEYTHQYLLDWRNESARNWWLDTKLGSIINSTVIDGFYWDDPVFGNEDESIRKNWTPEEVKDIDNHMQATRLEGYKRLSRGGGFCTGSTCYTSVPDVANCACVGDNNCTCDCSPPVVLANVLAAKQQSDEPVLYHVPYPYSYHNPDGGATVVTCAGPAVVQSTMADPTHVPHAVELSCLPGTGSMTVEFASFGLPATGSDGGIYPKNADCAAFATNTSCDAGPQVLQQLKAMCDGKQSCRFDTSHPLFERPATGCGGGAVPLSSLQLAVKATGCSFGTGSGLIFNFRQRFAQFLLARGDHWWFGNDWIANYAPVFLPEYDVDYGEPLGDLTVADGVIIREWSKMTIRLDTKTFEATFDSK